MSKEAERFMALMLSVVVLGARQSYHRSAGSLACWCSCSRHHIEICKSHGHREKAITQHRFLAGFA